LACQSRHILHPPPWWGRQVGGCRRLPAKRVFVRPHPTLPTRGRA
jgi:hypothetical protein